MTAYTRQPGDPTILSDAAGCTSVDQVARLYEGRYPVYDDPHLWPTVANEVAQRTRRECRAWYDPNQERRMHILVVVDGLIGFLLVETRNKYDDAALAVKVRRAVRATLNRVFGVR